VRVSAGLETPYFDITDERFSVASEEVMSARERSWCADTNYGLAVLRHQEVSDLLKDRRLIQGSAAWPALNGVTSGPFVDWWRDTVLNLEGDEHARLRRLLSPAFAPPVIRALLPRFHALAAELIDGFAGEGRCEFMSDFAEPYAARVTAILLGLPEDEWRQIADASTTLGLALGVGIEAHLGRIEAALAELFD
jgi:cytochrome P450